MSNSECKPNGNGNVKFWMVGAGVTIVSITVIVVLYLSSINTKLAVMDYRLCQIEKTLKLDYKEATNEHLPANTAVARGYLRVSDMYGILGGLAIRRGREEDGYDRDKQIPVAEEAP